jgi:hypothetical protein
MKIAVMCWCNDDERVAHAGHVSIVIRGERYNEWKRAVKEPPIKLEDLRKELDRAEFDEQEEYLKEHPNANLDDEYKPSQKLTARKKEYQKLRDQLNQTRIQGESSIPDFEDDLYITWTGSNSYFLSPYLLSKRRLWTYGQEYPHYVLKDEDGNFINERGEPLEKNEKVAKYNHKIVMPVIGQTNHGDRGVGLGAQVDDFDEASYNHAGLRGTALVQWWNRFKDEQGYYSLGGNYCASVAAKALAAGGGTYFASPPHTDDPIEKIRWTPYQVAEWARDIKKAILMVNRRLDPLEVAARAAMAWGPKEDYLTTVMTRKEWRKRTGVPITKGRRLGRWSRIDEYLDNYHKHIFTDRFAAREALDKIWWALVHLFAFVPESTRLEHAEDLYMQVVCAQQKLNS